MNYQKHYQLLIAKHGSSSKPEGYAEKHHILPRCQGGTNQEDNLVWFSAEAHYVAHQLLVKMNPNHFGLAHAAIMMTIDKHGKRTNNKKYSWLKKKSSKLRSIISKGKSPSAEARRKLSEKLKGKPLSVEHVEKIRLAKLGEKNPMFGKKMSEETLRKLSESVKKSKTTPEQIELQRKIAAKTWQNENYREIMKRAHTGRKNTEESKAKMVEAGKKVWQNRTPEDRKAYIEAVKAGWVKRKARLEKEKQQCS